MIAAAQNFGVRVGMEVTFPSGATSIYKTGAGVNAGITYRVPFARQFFFEPGVYFSYLGMNSEDVVEFDKDYYYWGAANVYGIRVPLNVGYRINAGSFVDVDIFTGPWLNVNVSARQGLLPNFSNPIIEPKNKINLFNHGWRHVDAQWGFGANVVLSHTYTIGLWGAVAMTPTARMHGNSMMRSALLVTLGYNF